jgi:hypothetical protein
MQNGMVKAQKASAAPMGGSKYNDTDPSSTGCSNTGSTVLSSLIETPGGYEEGAVDMRWSSSCQTNWSRVTSYDGSYTYSWAATLYYQSGDCAKAYTNYGPDGAGGTIWSPQEYAPTIPVEAYGNVEDADLTDAFGLVYNPGWAFAC